MVQVYLIKWTVIEQKLNYSKDYLMSLFNVLMIFAPRDKILDPLLRNISELRGCTYSTCSDSQPGLN